MALRRKKILLKGCEGFGNRILALLTSCLYAQLTDRELYVDWSDKTYSTNGENSFNRFFHSEFCRLYENNLETDTIHPDLWCGKLQASLQSLFELHPDFKSLQEPWTKLSASFSKIDYHEDILVMWSCFEDIRSLRKHFKGKFKSLRKKNTKTILKALINEHLSPTPRIHNKVNSFKEAHFHKKTIGVHIRNSDKKSQVKALTKRLDKLLSKKPELQIFLATDNIQVLKDLKKKHPNIISTSKWYPSSGEPMHKNPESPDPTQHGTEALVDMYLLAECDFLLTDESSSFAYVASLLSKAPAKNIYDSKKARFIPQGMRHFLWRFSLKLNPSSTTQFQI